MTALDLLGPMLAAIGVAAIVLALAAAASLWKLEAGRRIATWIAPAAGFMAGALLVRGLPPFPPVEAGGWIFWSAGVAAVAGCCAPRRPAWILWVGRTAVVAALPYVILRPLMGRVWEGPEALIWLGGIALAWLGAWVAMAQIHRPARGWPPLVLLVVATVGLSILLMVSGVASYSQYALALAGAVAGAGIGSLPFLRRFGPDSRPAVAMVAIPWMGLLIAGHFYADLPLEAAVLAAVALLSLFLPLLPRFKGFPAVWLLAIQLGWTILPLAFAIVTAYAKAPRFDY